MPIDYDQWMKSIYQHCDDPTQYNGADNPYIYECVICNETECDCEEEWGSVSNCCEMPMDNGKCRDCGDNCISSYQEALNICNVKRNGKS